MGTYSDDISNGQCELCPANSEANVTGLSVCPCIQNYYRTTDEEASVTCTRELNRHHKSSNLKNEKLGNIHCAFLNATHYVDFICIYTYKSCSESPSSPMNLTVSNVTNTSVVLSWLPPEDDGGRNISEIYYTVIAEGGQ